MTPSVKPQSGRSLTLTTALLALIVVMGLSPLIELVAVRWPPRFGEVPWRFQTLQLFLANGPQFVILIGVLALFGAMIGHRTAIRSASIALAVLAIITFVLLPAYTLDYFQVARIIRQDAKGAFKAEALKTLIVGSLLVVGSAWAALKGWRASEPPDAAARRAKGEGLVVGQPKPPRPPT